MSVIWNDLIDQAFVDLGVIRPGENITTTMRTAAQVLFNELLSSLSTEGAMAYQQIMQAFSLTAGTTNYTLGSGGNFATTGGLRAMKVTAWRAYYSGVLMGGGRVLSMEEFGTIAIQVAGELSAIPKAVAADTAYPLVNVRIFPPPSATPGTLELAYWTPITQIADFTVAVSLPDGWTDMLHFNLAISLAPQYARPGQSLEILASNATNRKASIVSQNQMKPMAAGAQ